jgi:hypothetical protein
MEPITLITKFQFPNKFQLPIPNNQTACLVIEHCLVIGAWLLVIRDCHAFGSQ